VFVHGPESSALADLFPNIRSALAFLFQENTWEHSCIFTSERVKEHIPRNIHFYLVLKRMCECLHVDSGSCSSPNISTGEFSSSIQRSLSSKTTDAHYSLTLELTNDSLKCETQIREFDRSSWDSASKLIGVYDKFQQHRMLRTTYDIAANNCQHFVVLLIEEIGNAACPHSKKCKSKCLSNPTTKWMKKLPPGLGT
jgi:hypothetical protein